MQRSTNEWCKHVVAVTDAFIEMCKVIALASVFAAAGQASKIAALGNGIFVLSAVLWLLALLKFLHQLFKIGSSEGSKWRNTWPNWGVASIIAVVSSVLTVTTSLALYGLLLDKLPPSS